MPDPTKVRRVAFDLMGVLAETREPKPRLLTRIYSEVVGRGLEKDEVAQALHSARRRNPQSRFPNPRERWVAINLEVLRRLGQSNPAPEVARELHERFTGDVSLYCLRPDMRRFLDWLVGCGVMLAIASNQSRDVLLRMLDALGLREWFGSRMVSGQDILRYKPFRGFFKRVFQRLGWNNPAEVLHIGNSVRHDVPGAWVVRTALIVRDSRGLPLVEKKVLHGKRVRRALREGRLIVVGSPGELRVELEAAELILRERMGPKRAGQRAGATAPPGRPCQRPTGSRQLSRRDAAHLKAG